ncbi:hypothetical protein ACQKII_17615 [Lysinibacillus sp. NPDC048646]|uniref:hypothetical protein n=1 Tax=Lysinibacillus sp. NPDC048646 TaxID=3390574 RepID=UPI003D03EF0D
MCESEAAATDVFCAKAKRQQQDVGHTSFSQDVKVLACVPLFIVGDEENPTD